MEKKYLTTNEVAEKFQVTSRTVKAWIKEINLPALRIGGRIRFDEKLLDEWVRKQNGIK